MRVDLPTGTVTFVFTDVEGSTRLLEELGTDEYAAVLAEHHRVCREAWAAHSGVEVDTAGDAFFVAFARASDALAASAAAQEALEGVGVRVRMGVHTGEVALVETGYVGMEVHRAARIAAAAHGGQVVVSSATRALVREGVGLLDLGEHRFKDLSAPERVFQLGDSFFPPLKSLYRTNLPVPATPFLGREAELGVVAGMLAEAGVRLVSLVGPGGTGKTRLALQAAAEASDEYPEGVFWAPLAPLRDAGLILPTVATALGVAEGKDSTPVDDLAAGLAGRRLLVFVDNLEHLLPEAADAVGALVAACPSVTTVVTTRERLQLPGERVYPVPPMSETDGEALFLTRAAAAGVELDGSEELRELCARLDNLPLALELAAARTVVFSPTQLLDRLGQRLDLLKAGRGVDARQETLRATISWSHDLLNPIEQQLFRRLSVFAGGCTYEAAEQITGADPDTLQSLLDKSLLRRRDGKDGLRYWMLEMIREFAIEQLAAAGETDKIQRRHLDHYAAVAEECSDDTYTGNDNFDRLADEHENLRLALDQALDTDPELALQLGVWLGASWNQRGEFREGREKLAEALARAPDTQTAARAWALRTAAGLAWFSDLDVAEGLANEALSRFRELDDKRGEGLTLYLLGDVMYDRGAYGEARRLQGEAVDMLSGPGDVQLQVLPLQNLALVAWAEGDYSRAVALNQEIVAKHRRSGSARNVAVALNNLGIAQESAGQTDSARQSLEESVALTREAGDKRVLAVSLHSLGHLTQATAPAHALAYYAESLQLFQKMDYQAGMAHCLEGGAVVHAARGDHSHTATLLGAAAAIRAQPGGFGLTPDEQAEVERVKEQCRRELTPDAFSRAWDDGAALDANAAADWALKVWEGEA